MHIKQSPAVNGRAFVFCTDFASKRCMSRIGYTKTDERRFIR